MQTKLIAAMTQYAGAAVRNGDVFRNRDAITRGVVNLKRGLTVIHCFSFLQSHSLQGVQNIYTEHKPLLKETLDSLLRNKLKDTEYPFAQGSITRDP